MGRRHRCPAWRAASFVSRPACPESAASAPCVPERGSRCPCDAWRRAALAAPGPGLGRGEPAGSSREARRGADTESGGDPRGACRL